MSYGASIHGRATVKSALYVGRILKGASPRTYR